MLNRRIQKVFRALKQEQAVTAMLIGSAVAPVRNHDVHYSFRQDSNVFYCTHSMRPKLNLLFLTSSKRPFLISQTPSALEQVWGEEVESLRSIARRINAEVIETPNVKKEILNRLKGVDILYYSQAQGSAAWECAQQLMQQSIVSAREYPVQFKHADLIFNKLRLLKDSKELADIKKAIALTHESLNQLVPLIKSGVTEHELRSALLAFTAEKNARVSFQPIVATGVSAAKPHYSAFKRKLKASELLLVDYGLEYNQYASDITRVLPVRGKFSEVEREIYQIVLEARKAVIQRLKPGVSFASCQKASETVLIQGLKELGVLRGKLSTIRSKGLHKTYTIHSVSHSLGLDVHDISKNRMDLLGKIQKGMVLTVEPGLYFNKKIRNIPACGVRLEDDIYVSANGAKNLSVKIPIEIEDVEAWSAV